MSKASRTHTYTVGMSAVLCVDFDLLVLKRMCVLVCMCKAKLWCHWQYIAMYQCDVYTYRCYDSTSVCVCDICLCVGSVS